MKSPQYENYYDNESLTFEELKMEVPDKEVPHSDCNVNNEIVSEDMKLSKFNVQNKIKHEATEKALPLNVTIKTERIEEEEILYNNKNMSVHYKLTLPDVQLNSDERLLKDNVNLLKPKNEQSNMPRVAGLNGVYKSEQHLRNRVKRMHTNKEHKGKCCGAVFKKNQYLTNHMNNVHYAYGHTLGCWCGKQFRSPIHLNERLFQCDSCQKIFTERRYLVRHIKRSHYDYGRTFDCWCGKQFRAPILLNGHKWQCHKRKIKDRFQCDSCQKIFKTKNSMVRHIKRFHYDYGRTFDCWCGKQYRSPEYLRGHKRRQHERTDNGRFQCDSCQKIFKKKGTLVLHIKRSHYGYGKTFDCWCGKQYRSPEYLRHHIRRQHERTDNGRFQCDSCQKIFKTKAVLVRHIKRFHYDYGRTFDCWCGKQYRSPEYLRHHIRRQHERINNGRFQCDICQKIFKTKAALVRHIKRFHYDYGRSFDCWCGKQYRSPECLRLHQRRQHKRTDNGRFQ